MTVPESIVHLEDSTIQEYLEKAELPVFIDFWAEWCRPCLAVAPIIEQLEKEYRGKMIFAKVDVDNNPDTSNRFSIMSIPYFSIIYKNKPINKFIGASPKGKFIAEIEKALKGIENKSQMSSAQSE